MLTGSEKLTGEITMIGRIGKSLTLNSSPVVIIIDMTIFTCRASAKPVAGLYLGAGLCSQHI